MKTNGQYVNRKGGSLRVSQLNNRPVNLLLIGFAFAIAGCHSQSNVPTNEIKVGDSMKSVMSTLKTWGAEKRHFSRYLVIIPEDLEDKRPYQELRAEAIAKNPYWELPAFSLPNGLIVDLHSEGERLTSISQEIVGESKLDHKTIEGFTGIRYDGDWSLTGGANNIPQETN